MNKDQIIDEVYETYKTIHKHAIRTEVDRSEIAIQLLENQLIYPQEEFINKIKTDDEFAKKWGLKIEERELSFEERWDLSEKYGYRKKVGEMPSETETFNGVNEREEFNSMMNDPVMSTNLPTKLITLTYNNETIESYE